MLASATGTLSAKKSRPFEQKYSVLAAGVLLAPRAEWHLCFTPNKAILGAFCCCCFFVVVGLILKWNAFAKVLAVFVVIHIPGEYSIS